MNESAKTKGKFVIELIREGKVIQREEGFNMITNEGFNAILDIMFGSQAKSAAWYIGLINNDPTFDPSDTLASHPGWTEGTNYVGDRKLWQADSANNGSIVNGTASEFTINANDTIYGAFLTDAETGSTGILWCMKEFASSMAVVDTDIIRVFYTVNAVQG